MIEKKIYFISIIIAIVGIMFGILSNNDNKTNGDALDVQERQARALENISKQLEIIANNLKQGK